MVNTITKPHERTAIRLAWVTIAYNVIEAVVSIAAGIAAGSIALVGFGLDSSVEVMSAVVIVWQFRGIAAARERLALRLIAISFFALGSYVAVRSAIDLASRAQPDSSAIGIAVAALSLIVMPFLARMKRRAGEAMGSATVLADSNQTQLCAYLSAILLGGLILNATVGWWWADPVAAIAIAALAINEGRQAWRGETCEAC